MKNIWLSVICLFSTLFLYGCDKPDILQSKAPFQSFFSNLPVAGTDVDKGLNDTFTSSSLVNLVDSAEPRVILTNDFVDVVRDAVIADPLYLLAQKEVKSRESAVGIVKSLKDFQFSGAVYGGVEDVTDETTGVALVLNANKLLYDGGSLDSQITAEQFALEAAQRNVEVIANERSLFAVQAWIDLERYRDLDNLILSRLAVLDPLIDQLEKVAEAGIGDVSQVAAAQRTVSLIRVTQTDVAERRQQARINFQNIYGALAPEEGQSRINLGSAVPINVDQDMILKSPGLMMEYAKYSAALKSLDAIEARDNFTAGFETRVQRPFGGSGKDSDESIGMVFQKTFYDGNKLLRELEQAEAQVKLQAEAVKSTYRAADLALKTSRQTIIAMDKAIELARTNAINARDEISYLRRQLIIGQSTLDSVLSAEARLYDAESQEINFRNDQKIAEVNILAVLGLLSELVGIN